MILEIMHTKYLKKMYKIIKGIKDIISKNRKFLIKIIFLLFINISWTWFFLIFCNTLNIDREIDLEILFLIK